MAEKNSGTVKNIVMVLFILAACGFVWMQMQKRNIIKQESQAVETMNDGNYQEAIQLFEKLQAKAKGEAVQRCRTYLAKCYIGMAEAEGISVAEQTKLYRQAADYDEDAITDPVILKLLERSRSKQEAGAAGDGANAGE